MSAGSVDSSMATPPDLPLPDPPDRANPLDAPADGLVVASPARRRPFLVGSPTLEVVGDELDGVERATGEAGDLLRELRTGGGPCSNVLLGPRGLRRELVGPGGTVLETLLVADRRPGFVAQWAAPTEGGLALDLRWRVPDASAHRTSGSVVRVRGPRGPDRLFALVPGPGRWQMETGPEGLEVRARIVADTGPVTLLAGTVERPDGGDRLLRCLARVSVLEARARRHLERVRTELLATRTGVAEVDDGLAWAVARITDAHPRRAEPEGLDRLWLVAGLLSAGDHVGALRWLESPPTHPGDVLALGWWMKWTGDAGPVRAHRDAVRRVLEGPGPLTPFPSAIGSAARREWTDALEAVEGRRTDGAPEPATRTPGPVTLPMVGGSAPGDVDATVLDAVVGEVGGRTRSPIRDGGSDALRAWSLYNLGRPDEAYLPFRDHLARGTRSSAGLWAGRGTASEGRPTDGPGHTHDPVAAALVPAVLLLGLLG
ncbi:MAG TPA: hypothetical protein VLL48_06405, partial [Longimicrobiales bacterium]|nr:hypothetical protein [Longimicrobiales bacterium]